MTVDRTRLLVAAIAIGLLAATTASVQAQSDTATPEEAVQLSDTVRDDLFELNMSTPKATWTADERVEITATAAYVGEETEMTVTGCWTGPVQWGAERLDGLDHYGLASTFDLDGPGCRHPETGDLGIFTFTQSLHGPEWPFWTAELEPRLSPGTWRIYALIRYFEAATQAEKELVAEVRIQVADDTDLPETD